MDVGGSDSQSDEEMGSSVILPSRHQSAEGDDSSRGDRNSPGTSFDRRLPVLHSYLGPTELGELSTKALYEEPGTEIEVPVLVMGVVLLPGQILPLQFYNPASIQFLSHSARQRSYFVLITEIEDDDENLEAADFSIIKSYETGTLFQIINAQTLSSDGDGDRLVVQAMGRQRCRLSNHLRRSNVYCEDLSVTICDKIHVEVLQDLVYGSMIHPANAWVNKFPNGPAKWFSVLTHHTSFAIRQSTTEEVVRRLKVWLQDWFEISRIKVILDLGITVFSYWVASQLPISLEAKMELLNEDCTDHRLKSEWRIASRMNSFACAYCADVKCSAMDIVNLSVEGNSSHFVNPSGFVHDLFTVKKMQGISLRGNPSLEFSWFPGYSWEIANCETCGYHLGWRFTSKKLNPKEFYGISRRSFRIIAPEDGNGLI